MMDDNEQSIEDVGDEDPDIVEYYEHEEKPYAKPQPGPYRNNFRNNRYNNAYGDYAGGYGPPGGGYPRNYRPQFGPPDDFYPPYGPPRFYPPGPNMGPYGGPPRLPGNFMWGRGFGPRGPPMRKPIYEDKTIRYLMRCGVPREHLKNLPRDLLQLMEPEYCGLCAMDLDSTAVSRSHYISKNHLKNQKKWLHQQSQIGFHRSKELPLKSRELYCELCDVHITSRIHSDSHYSGKQHRATVDGSRNPKNPMLLQNGMEHRLEQLIRREKKHLKYTQEEVVADKDLKSTQPELFCDICKTSVTCTEQMTMHLNGKRHLSKEKQHILKMMKGETIKDTTNFSVKEGTEDVNMENEADGGDEPEDVAKSGDGTGEQSFDWGSGEQKWDDCNKTQKEEQWV